MASIRKLAIILALSLSYCLPLAADRPNILFIAVDDLRPELETYGATPKTPNLNKLAKTGVRFDRAYCQQAVCGASRLSIMGGKYPTKTKEQTFHVDGWRKRHPRLLTLNQHFKASGYETIGIGKIYHGTQGAGVDEQNWNNWLRLTSPEYVLQENNEKMEAFKKAAKVGNEMDPPKGPTTESADVKNNAYADGKRARKVCKQLEKLGKSKGGKPFFLAVGFTKPHLPFNAPKKYWDLYKRSDFKMPNNKGLPPGYPAYAANLPAWEMKKYCDYVGEMPTDFPEEMNQRLLHGYAACVSYMDANVGMILKALAKNGLDENTIVVFWGDHGWKLGDHSSWCKHTNLECDTRVPLIVRAPGLTAGKASIEEVELIDIYPTLCDLAGIKTPTHCQGKSFKGLIEDPDSEHRECAYSSYPAGKKEIGHSIRMGNFRYTEWYTKADGKPTRKKVLTDLLRDPGEVTNVIKEEAYAETLLKAKRLLRSRVASAIKNEKTASQ